VKTERVLSMGFLRIVHSMTLPDKLCSCENRKILNFETLLRTERPEVDRSKCIRKDWRGMSCQLYPSESDPDVIQESRGVITYPSLLGLVVGWSHNNYLQLVITVYFKTCCSSRPSEEEEWV